MDFAHEYPPPRPNNTLAASKSHENLHIHPHWSWNLNDYTGVSKNRGGFPPNHPLKNRGFSIIFTIHFGGFYLYFWFNTQVVKFETSKALQNQLTLAMQEIEELRASSHVEAGGFCWLPFWGAKVSCFLVVFLVGRSDFDFFGFFFQRYMQWWYCFYMFLYHIPCHPCLWILILVQGFFEKAYFRVSLSGYPFHVFFDDEDANKVRTENMELRGRLAHAIYCTTEAQCLGEDFQGVIWAVVWCLLFGGTWLSTEESNGCTKRAATWKCGGPGNYRGTGK